MLRDHDRPHPDAAHRQHDADAGEPEEVRHGLGDRDRLEVEVALEQRHRDDPWRLQQEHEGKTVHHRLDAGIVEEVGREGCRQVDDRRHEHAREQRERERAAARARR